MQLTIYILTMQSSLVSLSSSYDSIAIIIKCFRLFPQCDSLALFQLVYLVKLHSAEADETGNIKKILAKVLKLRRKDDP